MDYFGSEFTTDTNDVQRSIVPPPARDWRAGATILRDHSSQQFTTSEHFRLDEARQAVIVLKLVGKSS